MPFAIKARRIGTSRECACTTIEGDRAAADELALQINCKAFSPLFAWVEEVSIMEVDGQRWRVKAKSANVALGEIAMARVTGSVGSSSTLDETLCGGGVSLIAEVHKIDEAGNDVRPS